MSNALTDPMRDAAFPVMRSPIPGSIRYGEFTDGSVAGTSPGDNLLMNRGRSMVLPPANTYRMTIAFSIQFTGNDSGETADTAHRILSIVSCPACDSGAGATLFVERLDEDDPDAVDATGTTVLQFTVKNTDVSNGGGPTVWTKIMTDADIDTNDGLIHVVYSSDSETPANNDYHIYIDGATASPVPVTTESTGWGVAVQNNTYQDNTYSIGLNQPITYTRDLVGRLANLIVIPGAYFDLDIAGTRNQFFDSDGRLKDFLLHGYPVPTSADSGVDLRPWIHIPDCVTGENWGYGQLDIPVHAGPITQANPLYTTGWIEFAAASKAAEGTAGFDWGAPLSDVLVTADDTGHLAVTTGVTTDTLRVSGISGGNPLPSWAKEVFIEVRMRTSAAGSTDNDWIYDTVRLRNTSGYIGANQAAGEGVTAAQGTTTYGSSSSRLGATNADLLAAFQADDIAVDFIWEHDAGAANSIAAEYVQIRAWYR